MSLAWSSRALRWIGLATAAVAALPSLTRATPPPDSWLVCAGLFAALWWWANGQACGRLPPAGRMVAMAGLALAALGLAMLGGSAIGATYPVLVAAIAGSVLAERPAFTLVAAQAVLLAVAFRLGGFGPRDALLLAAVFGALQIFVVYTAQVARAELRARRDLEEIHRRLRDAQTRLAESSRDAERLRIARELHDVLGHHLTALSLTLEAAAHRQGAARDTHVAEAQVLAKRLLREVRQLVSAVREPPDLRRDLERLAAEAKGPRVHLRWPENALDAGESGARALLRCAQEAITNAARHGEAVNLSIEIARRDEGWLLTARDDGHGAGDGVSPGHGLRGLEERFRELGGWARWGDAQGGGFELSAWLPRQEPA